MYKYIQTSLDYTMASQARGLQNFISDLRNAKSKVRIGVLVSSHCIILRAFARRNHTESFNIAGSERRNGKKVAVSVCSLCLQIHSILRLYCMYSSHDVSKFENLNDCAA